MRPPTDDTCYIATRPDGIIPADDTGSTDVDLTQNPGETITHPHPPYRFHLVTQPGEALHSVRPGTWPVRLFIAEPAGEAAIDDPHFSPYVRSTNTIRVIAETEPHHALGLRGRQVLTYLRDELPQQALRWAQAWTDDPAGTSRAFASWRLANTLDRAQGQAAKRVASDLARSSCREAALATAVLLAEQAVTAPDLSEGATGYAKQRAQLAVTAELLADRLGPHYARALHAPDLDTTTAAA